MIDTRTGEETHAQIVVYVDNCRAVDNPAIAERVVAQVTVRITPVELRCWRELGCGIAASTSVVGWTRTLSARTVGYVWLPVIIRTNLWTVVVRLVVRAVGYIAVVVRTIVVRTVGYIAVIVRLVVRTVSYVAVVVRTVVVLVIVLVVTGVYTALSADIAHVVAIISSFVNARVVFPALSCIAVRRIVLLTR